jgi:HK97 family phage prohead protease
MKYDFSGYATKNDLKCSDGRVIKRDAFKHNDGSKVPLVWQHIHNEPANILGHAILENREDGVYAYCTLNENEAGKNAKELVKHGDITALSIYANKLKQQNNVVVHGEIREVSLVLTGANPGAFIDNLNFAHSDGTYETDETEAVIYTGLTLSVEKEENENSMNKVVKHEDQDETVQDVFDTLNEKQKNVVYALLANALDEADDEEDAEHSDEGGNKMKKNVFDGSATSENQGAVLTHADFAAMVEDSKKNYNGSLKAAAMMHAQNYGVENIDYLFPDAKTITPTPEVISREMGWVPKVLAGTSHTPFSRIKSTAVDITAEEARALGYVKGNLKKEEVIKLLKRITGPTTIYKKQKLDRDDIIDITDLDVVAWLKAEMRVMLDEELARAVLVGDGRDAASEDKIDEECIRPIFKDADMYSHHIAVANNMAVKDLMDEIIRSREFYKGSGSPKLFTTTKMVMDMLLLKDTLGRRLYNTKNDLAAALLVDDIIEVPVLANQTRTNEDDKVVTLLGIIVNLKDYKMGADKGGAVNMFDDFDIDYNQYKYLIETRCSGALYKPKSAIVFERLPEVGGGE